MQKKSDNFLDKIVKKDNNNELEKILEKKYFEENVKSILLSILYRIETSYKDYKQVKQNVETKEELIEKIIQTIKENCNQIRLVKPNSEESKIIGNRTFLVEKRKGIIICYPIEGKLLYCIAKISNNDKIVKDKYFLVNRSLSNLINVGNNINMVEPLRDFNGYSWTTIANEMESIEHNLIYQNLILLVGNQFLNNWVKNKEIMLDYMELFQEKMIENYGEKLARQFIEILEQISIVIDCKFNKKRKEQVSLMKKEIEEKLDEIKDKEKFVEKITDEKRKITREIRKIDETINDKNKLQEEYDRRNEKLPLEEKIFSLRILSGLMEKERDEKINKLEKYNLLLNPHKFLQYKKEIENKNKYLEIIDIDNLQKEIDKFKKQLQKIFLQCFEVRLKKVTTKQEMIRLIYEYRYYSMLPYNNKESIYEAKELKDEIKDMTKKILEKSHELKVIERFSKDDEIDYELLKFIFHTRSINLEEIYIKLTKEKDSYTIYTYDQNTIEEKEELQTEKIVNKKDLYIRFGKKVKAFY